jgi:endonuclease/exonuclease/phosphatase family metal-dependent hydrolase
MAAPLRKRIVSGAIVLCASLFPTADGEPGQLPMRDFEPRCRETVTSALRPSIHDIEWVLATDSSELPIMMRWCSTIGPVVVEEGLFSGDAGDADSVAVITWNTHVGGGDIRRFVDDLRAGVVTGAPVQHFVLLLQEVYRASDLLPDSLKGVAVPARIAISPPSGKRVDIVQSARDAQLNLFYVPSMRNGAPPLPEEDRGNAVLSSMRLHGLRAVELPFEIQRRTAQIVQIRGSTNDGDLWQIALLNVHLDTRSRLLRGYASIGLGRRRQIQGALRALPDDSAAVIAGDFNTWAPDFAERVLPYLRALFDDTPVVATGSTFTAGRFSRRLDHMFFRLPDGWTATYRRLDSRYGSDHYPLLAWVHVIPTAAR